VAGGVALGDIKLFVGDPSWLAAASVSDLDGDGVVETNLGELTGLVGSQVVLQVEVGTDPAVVHTVHR
jgi:hypothetical protein